jgi:methyltransferase
MAFLFFISFLLLFRLSELLYSSRNEKWLLKNGAVEYGQNHYPYMVAMHVCFLISLITEYSISNINSFSGILMALYFILVIVKVNIIMSLGHFWNTKIYRIAHFPLMKKGLYKYISHPNYIIVATEIALIPLIFHLYITAVLFTILNAAMLYVRIKEENKALLINSQRTQ